MKTISVWLVVASASVMYHGIPAATFLPSEDTTRRYNFFRVKGSKLNATFNLTMFWPCIP